MKLSELAVLADGDPELMIDGPNGWPVPIAGADRGVMTDLGSDDGPTPYLLLETSDGDPT